MSAPVAAEAERTPRALALAGESELRERQRRGRGGAALVAALVLVSALALGQYHRARGLAGQVQELSTELEAAQAALVAHQRRMEEVRVSVDDLSAKVGLLRELVSEDPSPAE